MGKRTKNLGRFQRDWSRQVGLTLFIIAVSVAVDIRNPRFFSVVNLSDMISNTAILSILAIGMMIVIITAGIDLSIASTMALSGMVTALTVQANRGLSPMLALLIGLAVGVLCGGVISVFVVRFSVAPIIATLGFMNAYRGLTYLVSHSNWVGPGQMSNGFMMIARGKILGINNLVIIAMLLYLLAFYFLNYTRFGRQIYAVGSNAESAKVSGINTNHVLFTVYVIMGAFAGLAGVLWVSKFASAQGDTALGYEMNVIAACVLGGVSLRGGSGKLSGVLLGSLLLGILNDALPLIDVSPFWQSAIQGAIILVAVISNVFFKRRVEYKTLARRNI
ncbi:Branched-chain amino acid transport system / permease component [Acididesulfobacillus acetoxydans]|uniref:Branched-chain amino acid transport system / permease component n=1 Tax=Acididesulfobacillus acetoxydans TaxID=1561005 RepID=A0A8S0VWW6_9FIRM|nr:ABC transporter permease [Acididesulfobacillus acetoxydans]CAA7601313.1 Branched-chain amino acid transport system / permease component [Acididesulfobacillus acetoxydans]CEJ08777.1 Ribose transport system permease protein RbsC [Acididesulfobacillus acetoxydans]